MNKIVSIAIAIMFALCLTGCGSTRQAEHAQPEKFIQIEEAAEELEAASEPAAPPEQELIIEEHAPLVDAAVIEEPVYEEYYDHDDSYYYQAPATSGYDNDFRSRGVVYEDGVRYTWYSQRTLPGTGLTELNESGRHVNDDGYVVDGDGYIAVAAGDHAKGDVITTPFGEAKVYDYCPTPGVIDVYTDF